MTDTNSDNAAVMRGYTRHVQITAGDDEFTALVQPDTDLDGSFRCFDTDNQVWLTVNGWLCLIEDC